MNAKQELYDLLAEQLNVDLSMLIERLENAVLRSKIYTHDNGTTLYRLKVLIHKAAKLRDSIVTTADNGLDRSDPWYTSYRVEEGQPEYARAYEGLRDIALAKIAALRKTPSGAENTLKTE